MPAGRESIANTPLSGAELRAILIADFTRLVESHGLLSNHVAYGRIAYEIILRLHPANATFRDNTPAAQNANDIGIVSRPIAGNLVKENPALAAIERPPLAGATDEDSVVVGSKVTRSIDSPNLERLREGLPIPTTVRDQNNQTRVEMVHREADPSIGPGNVRVEDDTDAAREAWKLPPEAPPPTDADAPSGVHITEVATWPEGYEPPVVQAPSVATVVSIPAMPKPDPELERARRNAEFFGVPVEEFLDTPATKVDGAKMAEYSGSDPT